MSPALDLLALLGVLGAIDTVYYHECRGRLPVQHGGIDTELKLHAGRDAVYVVVFGTLPWLEWHGALAGVLGLLLMIEIAVTMTDFVVEDRVRIPLGGLGAGERVLHALMAIVYGAMLAFLVPTLATWSEHPTTLAASTASAPTALRIGLTVMAAGIAVSGLRDLLAANGVAWAAFPWRPIRPDRAAAVVSASGAPRQPTRSRPADRTAIGVPTLAVVTLAYLSSRSRSR